MGLSGVRFESVLRKVRKWAVKGFVGGLVHGSNVGYFGDGVDFTVDDAPLEFARGLLHAGVPEGAGGDVGKRGDGFIGLVHAALSKQRLVRAPNGAVLGEDEDAGGKAIEAVCGGEFVVAGAAA